MRSALGMGKDYKTRDRKVKRDLEEHTKRMNALIETGLTREEASKQAFEEMMRERGLREKEAK